MIKTGLGDVQVSMQGNTYGMLLNASLVDFEGV
jgi:hypothetical protein